jgi:hypothetical protein
LLCASHCRTIPNISTRRTQAVRLFAQAIHIAVHSNQGRLVRITVAQAASDLAQPVELACLSVAGASQGTGCDERAGLVAGRGGCRAPAPE